MLLRHMLNPYFGRAFARCETSNGTDNFVGTPRWAADFIDPKMHGLAPFPAKVDPTQFLDAQAILVSVTAVANIGDTSLTISQITLPLNVKFIPAGTTLYFGNGKVAVLSALYTNEVWNIDTDNPYTTGTTLSVNALPAAFVGGETAYYLPFPGRCQINSGTLVSRTFAARDSGSGFHPAVATDDEFYILAFDIQDANMRNEATLYRSGAGLSVKENYLPQWASLNTPVGAVNEVQTVVLTGATGGGFIMFGINASTGNKTYSPLVAYNSNLAGIQTALNDIFGAGLVVAAGTVTDFTLTYSGAGYAGMPQPLIGLDLDGLTGFTAANGAHTTPGVAAAINPLLARLRAEYICVNGTN